MKPFIVVDTETAPQKFFNPRNMDKTSLVYDLGYIITDGETILRERSFIIAETFFNAEMMNSAYYTNKLPQYHAGMGKEWNVISFIEAWYTFKADCAEFGITTMWAYNARFDRNVLNHTIEHYSNGFTKSFFPCKMRIKDIWSAAGDTVCNTKKYVKWCMEHGFVNQGSGNPQTSAEIVYRYITNDNGFIEDHTALSDCQIELEILKAVLKRKQKKNTKPNGNGWRAASKIAKGLDN